MEIVDVRNSVRVSKTSLREIRDTLLAAKEKLQLYRDNYGGEYLGGMEFTALMKRIDSALNS